MRTILHSKRFFFRSNMTFSLCLWLLEHFFGLFSYVNKVVKSSWDSADQQRINFWIVIIYSGRNNNVNGYEGSYWERVGRNNIYISRKVSQNRLNFINRLDTLFCDISITKSLEFDFDYFFVSWALDFLRIEFCHLRKTLAIDLPKILFIVE